MNVPWSIQLEEGQLANPILTAEDVGIPSDFPAFELRFLVKIFAGMNHSLKTWGRTPGVKEMDPHWIATRKQTPLHVDPAYPRYSYHLKMHGSMALRGLDKVETKIKPGLFIELDTHSPHQVVSHGAAEMWSVAISVDSKTRRPKEEILNLIHQYGRTHSMRTGEYANL